MSIVESEIDPPAVEEWLAATSGRLAFDVGANQGRLTAELAERFERVMAFEPCVESVALIYRLALPNVTVVDAAVSDRPGEVRLAEQTSHIAKGQLTSPDFVGDGAWSSDGGLGWGQVTGWRTVPATTLDVLGRRYAPDFVKVDVEGHEERVVAGGLRMFSEHRPAFYIEVHDRRRGHAIESMLAPLYPRLAVIQHPGYAPGDYGHRNHYWLVSEAR
ncbi:FkbM family methyltransferase [Actinomycetospora termitidis]|uniref:FkbM family methyltransferase n=1 Tax=Actinomycetospora termitidis TaxID=3053470 RepID=A0ABT7MHP4_9PSEU|nr:FkbM family methyltransferase [Actinomycetospora sp. Odt1-22]MDL5159407.1 FkbM family methyltransferase [Actinomycetospora sp. Odt1-22]